MEYNYTNVHVSLYQKAMDSIDDYAMLKQLCIPTYVCCVYNVLCVMVELN